MKHPDPFIDVRVHHVDWEPGLSGVCAGYEDGQWRCAQLAQHLLEWLPEFALTHSERRAIADYNAVHMVSRAADAVYASENYGRRGEIGGLLLHVVLRQVFGTLPAVSKLYFKDSANDTVKGFDAVHVVAHDKRFESWLGEVKFYKDVATAIRDVVPEIEEHTEHDYLRSEFAAIGNKIDDEWAHAETLRALIHRNQSLDQVFAAVCVPVLLTYDSDTVSQYDAVSTEYEAALCEEVERNWKKFATEAPDITPRIHLILFPMKSKADLASEFDTGLKAWQTIPR